MDHYQLSMYQKEIHKKYCYFFNLVAGVVKLLKIELFNIVINKVKCN